MANLVPVTELMFSSSVLSDMQCSLQCFFLGGGGAEISLFMTMQKPKTFISVDNHSHINMLCSLMCSFFLLKSQHQMHNSKSPKDVIPQTTIL
jgi:hypothetical protein